MGNIAAVSINHIYKIIIGVVYFFPDGPSPRAMLWLYMKDGMPEAHLALETNKYHISFVTQWWPNGNKTVLPLCYTRELDNVMSSIIYNLDFDISRQGVNFTNILQEAFSCRSVLSSFSTLIVCVYIFLAKGNLQKS